MFCFLFFSLTFVISGTITTAKITTQTSQNGVYHNSFIVWLDLLHEHVCQLLILVSICQQSHTQTNTQTHLLTTFTEHIQI